MSKEDNKPQFQWSPAYKRLCNMAASDSLADLFCVYSGKKKIPLDLGMYDTEQLVRTPI